jgi:hypothetical protein
MKPNRVLSLLSRLALVVAARTMVVRPRQNSGLSRFTGVFAIFLVLTQVVAALPVPGYLRRDGVRRPAPEVVVNRTQPVVEAPPTMPVFSVSPTDAEITRARVFEEPFVRMSGLQSQTHDEPSTVSESENRVLGRAIIQYLEQNEPEDVSLFTAFLNKYPQTAGASLSSQISA